MLVDKYLNFYGFVFCCGGQQGDWGLVVGGGRVDDNGVWAYRCFGLVFFCVYFFMILKR